MEKSFLELGIGFAADGLPADSAQGFGDGFFLFHQALFLETS